jgi:hypothetical protein
LKVRSTFLGSLGLEDKVKVEEAKDKGGVVPIMIRRGRKINLPVQL